MKLEDKVTRMWETREGTLTGEVRAMGETFWFTAKIGEWVDVQWHDAADHNYKKQEHAAAVRFLTRKYVTNVKKLVATTKKIRRA